ncbi:MAG: fibronectin type III domain-containing protein [candidate division Zixibacteria bacterium]|nr:fibronectin type III domain-containing protein [candidate division Zixibacteria bacterium]
MRYKNLNRLLILTFFFFFLILPLGQILAQEDTLPPAPPTEVRASDTQNDNGHSITITWKLSGDDGAGKKDVVAYEILRSESPAGEFVVRGMVPAGNNTYQDRGAKEKEDKNYFHPYHDFYYKVRAKTLNSYSESGVAGPAQAYGQWFHLGKLPVFVGTLAFTIMVLAFISLARKGKKFYVRPLAGIDAVDDAIGRATEMGRPILYILGLGSAADIATIASFTILNRIAKKTAEHKTKIIVPCNDPIVMSVAQETVKAGYLDAGRPDMYQEENIFYITSMQFAYVAAVNGIMLREKTATNFYLGKFYAESLILAETGSVAGSIQISGTDEIAQIPFFVAATDYTLIGEELYAASAYLGREPLLLGALKAQDLAKAIVMISLASGAVAASFHLDFFLRLFTVQM